jgi:hypothetical protein
VSGSPSWWQSFYFGASLGEVGLVAGALSDSVLNEI